MLYALHEDCVLADTIYCLLIIMPLNIYSYIMSLLHAKDLVWFARIDGDQ